MFCSAVGIPGLKGQSWRKEREAGEAAEEFWRDCTGLDWIFHEVNSDWNIRVEQHIRIKPCRCWMLAEHFRSFLVKLKKTSDFLVYSSLRIVEIIVRSVIKRLSQHKVLATAYF